MNKCFYYYDPNLEYMQGNFIDAETISKARYKIWLKGGCEYYETFGQFIKNLKIRKVS